MPRHIFFVWRDWSRKAWTYNFQAEAAREAGSNQYSLLAANAAWCYAYARSLRDGTALPTFPVSA